MIVDEGEVPFFRQEPGVAIRDQFCMAVTMGGWYDAVGFAVPEPGFGLDVRRVDVPGTG